MINIDQVIQSQESERKSKQHVEDSVELLLFLFLLVLVVLTVWLFKYKRLSYVHETSLAIFYGAVFGAILRYSRYSSDSAHQKSVVFNNSGTVLNSIKDLPEYVYMRLANQTDQFVYIYKEPLKIGLQFVKEKATFDPEIFFEFLLPPIIFNAGYGMKRKSFFKNFGSILLYAIIGTILSCFIVGGLLYGMVSLPGWFNFGFSDCLLFGALISATDPVTTLAIFQDKNVDLNLYSMIFGESVLNDAVSIILVQQIENYKKLSSESFNESNFFGAIGSFLAIFFGSFAIGSSIGCVNALLTKFTRIKEQSVLETALFFLISYLTFVAAEACEFSGIVAVLFCGVFQAHYTYNNLSEESQAQTRQIFHLLSFLSENFIFIYIGITMFTFKSHQWHAGFICASFFAIAVARAANIYPLSFLVNLTRKPDRKISFKYQHLMFFSGLRGAMAFALAIRNVSTNARQLILTTTSIIVIVTVIFCGGLTPKMIELLGIRSEDEISAEKKKKKKVETPIDLDDPNLKINPVKKFILKIGIFKMWHGFDATFMKPLLTHYRPSLLENMPKRFMPIARILTSKEQIESSFKPNDQQNLVEEEVDKINDEIIENNSSDTKILQMDEIHLN